MPDELKSIVVKRVVEPLCAEPVENYVIEGSLKINGVPFDEFKRSLEEAPTEKNV